MMADDPRLAAHEIDTSLPLLQPGIVPGWYRDPDDPLHHRYWTGDHWETERERLRREDAPPAPSQRQG